VTEVAGSLAIGPPKTMAARCTVTLPGSVARELFQHLDGYIGPGTDALAFTSSQGGMLSRTRFRAR
jgi:hypothetical protein